jgi:hypothetical protein
MKRPNIVKSNRPIQGRKLQTEPGQAALPHPKDEEPEGEDLEDEGEEVTVEEVDEEIKTAAVAPFEQAGAPRARKRKQITRTTTFMTALLNPKKRRKMKVKRKQNRRCALQKIL